MQVDEQRFGGIGRLYGREGLQRLADSHVAVVGIGGVGSWAAEALARSGVGEISLFDLDDVCVTNTNRQVHAIEGSVGKAKVEVMAARIRAINPACRVHAVADFVTRETMAEYIVDFDYLIDCIDSVAAKAALIAWCKRRKIPVITTGGAGGQVDLTQIQVADLNKTFNDPLAAKVRSTLRRDYNFSRTPGRTYSVPCVFSSEQLRYPKPDGTVPVEEFRRRRGEAGLRRRLRRGDDGHRHLRHGRRRPRRRAPGGRPRAATVAAHAGERLIRRRPPPG